MSVKFYVDNIEKNIETNASFRATQDDSLDDGSLVLEWMSSESAIKPRTPVRIDEFNDNNQVIHSWCFSVLSDDIEPVDKANTYFLHRLTLIQNTNDLSHRFLRNSSFQQPLEELNIKTIANGYVFAKKQDGVFSMSGKLVLPIWYNGTTPNYNTYRKDKVYISEREKINNVFIELDSWALCWSYPEKAGENRINLTMQQSLVRDWLRNAHASFNVILEYRENEDDATPSQTTTINISAGSRANKKQVQQIAKTFFTNNGAGWYSLALDTDNMPTFSLTNNEISFAVTEDIDQAVSGVNYPTIQGRFEINLKIDTYYYSIYDILEAIQLQSKKTLSNEDRATAPYYMTSVLNDLKEIVAPDMQFNGTNVFDAVSQVFNYIDAVPLLTKDKELDYEFLNEFDGTTLPSDYAFADKKTRLEDKYFDNEIITQYSNAKQPTSIWYPGNNFYKKLETQTKGIVSNTNDYQITTDKPIEKIDELNIYFAKEFDYTFSTDYTFTYNGSPYQITSVSYKGFYLPNYKIDISARVVESSIFGTLEVGTYDSSDMYQTNTISFNRGSNSFQVGLYEELGYTRERLQYVIERCWHEQWDYNVNTSDINMEKHTNWNFPNLYEYYYSIKYVATFDGQVMIESPENKADGQFVVAQNSSSTALNKMGSNMLGFIAKTGNESKAVTMQLSTYDTRLVKGSIWVDASGNKWIANIVKITFTTSEEIITEVEFVKNFNMISQRTQVDEEIKYSVLNQQMIAKGYENVNEFLYFSKSAIAVDENTSFYDTLLDSLLKGTFLNDSTQKRIDYCSIHLDNNDETYIPIHIYGAGNIINFEFNYEHPLQAGSYVTNNGTIQSYNVLYTKDGFGDQLFVLMRSNDIIKTQYNYPYTPSTDNNEVLIGFKYEYYKRPNEILSFNYGIALMGLQGEEIYFGEELLSQNYLIPNNKYENATRKLYLYVSFDEKYAINDKKAKDGRITSTSLVVNVNTTNRYISFTAGNNIYGTIVSWCIADENGNIYIAVNEEKEVNGSVSVGLYYARKKARL